MCNKHHANRHILCSKCDMLLALPEISHEHKAVCPRCRTTLIVKWRDPKQRLTAYTIAALFMLLLSNLFPFIYIKFSGITSQIKLLEIPNVMFSEDYAILGTFLLLFVQIIPTFCLMGILLLVNRVHIPLQYKIWLARILFQLKSWGMAEIFLAGILVSFVKLMTYSDVGIGSSFIPWCLYCILQLRAFHCVDRHWIWNSIEIAPIFSQHGNVGIPGICQGLRSCSCCTAVLPSDQHTCPRCGTKGYSRRKNSFQRTVALLWTSIILYLPANILPIMITDLLGNKTPSTIMSGIILLWREGSYSVAGVIFIASIIVPTLKMAAIAWLCFNTQRHGKWNSKRMHLLYEVVESIGRWSMIDVFVISVLSALVHINGFINIYPALGVLMFASVIIFTMFAAITFDPRLSWDRELQSRCGEKSEKMKKINGEAEVKKVRNWSPVWFFPIVTTVIGSWILFYHYRHQGPEVTLISTNAEGIEGGKTTIKNRNVDVGIVEEVTLNKNLTHVEIRARLNSGMEKLLHNDSVFWVVKPKIGREGISNLGTFLSGAYIEFQSGSKGSQSAKYKLLDSPPLAPPDTKGIRILLESKKAVRLNPGAPVLFHGYHVGLVETSSFDPNKRTTNYQLFINSPNDHLVTSNVRFWKDSDISVDVTSTGMRVEMASLTTLFSGSVSFDVPEGLDLGQPVAEKTLFCLFENKNSIQDTLYSNHIDYLMFFRDSIRGLHSGSPVEFRGIRLGTVIQVPFFRPGLNQTLNDHYYTPVLIRIEPERFLTQVGINKNIEAYITELMNQGLRGCLKTTNMVVGTLYVDMDFYPKSPPISGLQEFGGYQIIPTVSSELVQIQQRFLNALNKINDLPLKPMIEQATSSLNQSHAMIHCLQAMLININNILTSQSVHKLPKDIHGVLYELNRSVQGFQQGSIAYNNIVENMQRLDHVLRELQPLLRTLNDKSNALVFKAKSKQDPVPKRAKE